jgi:PBSX family phage portal protein
VPEPADQDNRPKAEVYRLVPLAKATTPGAGVVVSNAFEVEDEFKEWYSDGGLAATSQVLIAPPYHLKLLDRLAQENNALGPCVEAMVTNVDGTGQDFERDPAVLEPLEDGQEDPAVKELEDFFSEPWPGVSFTTIRKELRRDLERTGNAYLEIVPNANDEIVFLRRVDAKMMRLVRLDAAVEVTRTVRRKGQDVEIRMLQRERRFAQLLEQKTLVYFKEFGASRDLDKTTGKWAGQGERLPANKRATEILHFTCLPDAHTPYGVPRWINQVPSVLGSRKAEEFNLDFFDHGGVPPIMIMLQGGVLAHETRKALEQRMGVGAAKANRVQIIEAEPVGGSLEHPSQVRITVERFGAERQSDSMFEKYDERAEIRVRRSFRLPPIFVGQAQDYSFATAYASYTVAEAQVFKPEREEFDEQISIKLLPKMGFAGYRMRSHGLQIQDVPNQLAALQIASGSGHVEPQDLIEAINELVGLNLTPTEQPVVPAEQPLIEEVPAGGGAEVPIEPPTMLKLSKTSEGVLALATDTALALRKRDLATLQKNLALACTLVEADQAAFRQALATWQFLDPSIDHDGFAELAGCTLAVMHSHAA